jgi:hypothetical protein
MDSPRVARPFGVPPKPLPSPSPESDGNWRQELADLQYRVSKQSPRLNGLAQPEHKFKLKERPSLTSHGPVRRSQRASSASDAPRKRTSSESGMSDELLAYRQEISPLSGGNGKSAPRKRVKSMQDDDNGPHVSNGGMAALFGLAEVVAAR